LETLTTPADVEGQWDAAMDAVAWSGHVESVDRFDHWMKEPLKLL
jgi:hypothetical protein